MIIVQNILRSFRILPSIKQVYLHFSTDRNIIRSNNTKKQTDIVSLIMWHIRIKKLCPQKPAPLFQLGCQVMGRDNTKGSGRGGSCERVQRRGERCDAGCGFELGGGRMPRAFHPQPFEHFNYVIVHNAAGPKRDPCAIKAECDHRMFGTRTVGHLKF